MTWEYQIDIPMTSNATWVAHDSPLKETVLGEKGKKVVSPVPPIGQVPEALTTQHTKRF
ncbi:hypothetical protein DAPPUDRAFT_343416 [Daphnia pulex]|uniref:Uncharacterized protein n=1 Tax=Daphnia pulex TaxID=6669 RepID=E9I6R1_DAPPU|nr:hypothetical protein DAPPUDRAFT_343416 [Daphnia pulex]|eukprot:EFX60319.1 hypothetical protein DAPPUDRAFT_343416 [Daphnia pulex]